MIEKSGPEVSGPKEIKNAEMEYDNYVVERATRIATDRIRSHIEEIIGHEKYKELGNEYVERILERVLQNVCPPQRT